MVDNAKAPLGYSPKDNTINLSPERANDSRVGKPGFNGQALYAAAQAELIRSGTAPAAVSGAAYLAAERLASKLRVPYSPIRLAPEQREDLARLLQAPKWMHELTALADEATTRVVDRATGSEWDRPRQPMYARRPSSHRPSDRTTPDQKLGR